ncbi:unnamed protein product [Candidula unifasciata]|uniref:Uncharacterized protein n=1 Tax=Candidula unifasciata TaxID=100452 RepID=A0A8S3Z2Y9_9EUPU|nr:unnamed protein product [Candidula unifasciata]
MQSSTYKILKVCVLGDLGVGKTSLTTRFVTENFVDKYKPTYQACHFHKYLHTPDSSVYIQIWDTSGTERFRSLSPHILRDSNGALLVYDVTNLASFVNIDKYWIKWIRDIVPDEFRLVLVGNKIDKSASRQIDSKMAKRFAADNSMLYYETSAKTGESVDVVFLDVVNLLADTIESSYSESLEVPLTKDRKHSCCF